MDKRPRKPGTPEDVTQKLLEIRKQTKELEQHLQNLVSANIRPTFRSNLPASTKQSGSKTDVTEEPAVVTQTKPKT